MTFNAIENKNNFSFGSLYVIPFFYLNDFNKILTKFIVWLENIEFFIIIIKKEEEDKKTPHVKLVYAGHCYTLDLDS